MRQGHPALSMIGTSSAFRHAAECRKLTSRGFGCPALADQLQYQTVRVASKLGQLLHRGRK